MPRTPLPPELGPCFSTSAALAAGVTRARLRSRDLSRPFHGVRSTVAPADEGDLGGAEQRMLRSVVEYAPRMTEHEFFSHVTAAVIWGLPLPLGTVTDRAPDVSVLLPRRAPAGRGVLGHALTPSHTGIVQHPVLDLSVTTPATTWALLGGALRRLEDLVAVADAAVRVPLHRDDPPALTTPEELAAALDAGRRRGAPVLRAALPLVNTRSRSRAETWLSLILLDCRLPTPEVNFDVFDRGVWIAQVDLAFPRARVALEYEGDQHRTDAAQWAKDLRRYERLADAGWRVIRVTREDVFVNPTLMIDRVRRLLRAHEG